MLGFAEDVKEIVILDENGEPLKAGDEDRRYRKSYGKTEVY